MQKKNEQDIMDAKKEHMENQQTLVFSCRIKVDRKPYANNNYMKA